MKEAQADDLTTLDGIIHALYDSISGPAGVARDGRRFRSLFLEGARLVRTSLDEGGAADEAERLMRALPKATRARVIFDDDPERLLDACLAALGRPEESKDACS